MESCDDKKNKNKKRRSVRVTQRGGGYVKSKPYFFLLEAVTVTVAIGTSGEGDII